MRNILVLKYYYPILIYKITLPLNSPLKNDKMAKDKEMRKTVPATVAAGKQERKMIR